jgi:hypothetical protein
VIHDSGKLSIIDNKEVAMQCIISGCNNVASHNFSVRLRRPDTTAIWAPNTEAYLCDLHAAQGVRIKVFIETTDTGMVETEISSLGRIVTRTTPIQQIP